MRRNGLVFREMLDSLRSESATRSFKRAQLASRLAKIAANDASAKTAYQVKNAAVSQAIDVAPEQVQLGDQRMLKFGLVGVFMKDLGGLHVHVQALTPSAVVVMRRRLGV